MTLPTNASNLPVPAMSRLPVPASQVPGALAVAAARALPALRASAGAVVVGLGVEFVLRALANRALLAVTARGASAVTPLLRSGMRDTVEASRTVVTEIVIRERIRRGR